MKLSFGVHWHRYLWLFAAVIAIYVLISYLILPATWSRIEHEPGLSKRTMVTSTAQGIPGGAINVGLIGTREDVVSAFHAAGWYPADPVTLRTSLEIIGSVSSIAPTRTRPSVHCISTDGARIWRSKSPRE